MPPDTKGASAPAGSVPGVPIIPTSATEIGFEHTAHQHSMNRDAINSKAPDSMSVDPDSQPPLALNSIPGDILFMGSEVKQYSSHARIFLDICCGVNAPLSNAVHRLKGDHIKFDILVHELDDLLNSISYERLLRLCSSGLIAYAAASPSCCEYSRLKLLPNGPPALRTPSHLQGVPGLSGPELQKVQESFTMLERCVNCLNLTVSAGGHSHLEQPKTAMSWEEPVVQAFIQQHACICIFVLGPDRS